MRRLLTAGLHVLALLLGATTCVAAVAVHLTDVARLPLGLLLGLAASFATAWGLRLSGVRRLATSYAAGWLVVFGLVVAGRPEGDYAVAGDVSGYLMIGAAFAMVVVGISSLGQRGSDSVAGRT